MTPQQTSPLNVLLEFFRLLRVAGVRIGLTETQDALKGLAVVQNLRWARVALKATLVKRKRDEATFERVFDLFFARNVQEALVLLSEMVQKQAPTNVDLDQIRFDLESAFLQTIEVEQATPALEALLGQGDVDDVDFAHMDRSEALLIEEQIEQLIDTLLTRPGRRNKPDRRGRLDLRRTVRKSLQYGGTPIRLARKKRHVVAPKMFVLTDISSSVEVFSRFFLMLTRAFQTTASACRSFVFVDELFEVSDSLQTELERAGRAGQAVERMLAKLKASGWTNRRSDYGTTLQQFRQSIVHDIDHHSTIVILGDARNNNAPSQAQALQEIHDRVARVLWLNPERSALWNTGDSILRVYAPYCDPPLECRNLAQLRNVVHMLSAALASIPIKI